MPTNVKGRRSKSAHSGQSATSSERLAPRSLPSLKVLDVALQAFRRVLHVSELRLYLLEAFTKPVRLLCGICHLLFQFVETVIEPDNGDHHAEGLPVVRRGGGRVFGPDRVDKGGRYKEDLPAVRRCGAQVLAHIWITTSTGARLLLNGHSGCCPGSRTVVPDQADHWFLLIEHPEQDAKHQLA